MGKDNLIILAFYTDITKIPDQLIQEYIKTVDDSIKLAFENITDIQIKYFVIPTAVTKVECIYPLYVTKDTIIKKQEDTMNNLNKMVELINQDYTKKLTPNDNK